jgi:hypothetical protein
MMDDHLIRSYTKSFLSEWSATITTLLGEENTKLSKPQISNIFFDDLVLSESLKNFLTVPAYQYI